jgi:hypothetical protein
MSALVKVSRQREHTTGAATAVQAEEQGSYDVSAVVGSAMAEGNCKLTSNVYHLRV